MKECKYCKSEIHEEAKICPNCKRSQVDEIKLAKKTLKVFGIVLLIIFVTIIVLALISPSIEEEYINVEFANLEEIYELHAQNVPKAEELYEDKPFKFTGKITHIYKNYIQIQSDYICADVYFHPNYKEEAFNYNVGDTITYCGKINFSLSIQVKDAIIVKED